MVDAADSKSAELTLVRVRVPPSVPDNAGPSPAQPAQTAVRAAGLRPQYAPCPADLRSCSAHRPDVPIGAPSVGLRAVGVRAVRAAPVRVGPVRPAALMALVALVVAVITPLPGHGAPPDSDAKAAALDGSEFAPSGATRPDLASDLGRPLPLAASTARWRLGADVRLRGWASRDVERLGGLEGDHGAAFRARLAAAGVLGDSSALVELQSVGHFGGATSSGQAPLVGLQQAVIAWDGGRTSRLRVEAGRLHLRYGVGRHVGDFDFDAQGNAYDGGRLRWRLAERLQVDLIGVRPRASIGSAAELDGKVQGGKRKLIGAYAHAQPLTTLDADLYLLALDGYDGDRRVLTQTMGMRLGWRAPRLLSLDAEAAAQVGAGEGSEVASEGHLAWMAGMRLRLRGEAALRFEAGLMFDVWSGDADPTDGVDGAWRPLHGDTDRMVGALQRFEVSNLQVLGAFAEFGLSQRWLLKAEARLFARRAADDEPGSAGALGWRAAGTEIDVHFRWNVSSVIALEALFATFLPSQAPTDPSGGGRDPAVERVTAATAMMLQLRAQL